MTERSNMEEEMNASEILVKEVEKRVLYEILASLEDCETVEDVKKKIEEKLINN